MIENPGEYGRLVELGHCACSLTCHDKYHVGLVPNLANTVATSCGRAWGFREGSEGPQALVFNRFGLVQPLLKLFSVREQSSKFLGL